MGAVHVEGRFRDDEVMDRCSVVVCHGGLQTVYRALSRGVPVVAVPEHFVTERIALRLQEVGAGVMVSSHAPGRARLVDTVVEAMSSGTELRTKAREWQDRIAAGPRSTRLADVLTHMEQGLKLGGPGPRLAQ